MVSCFKVACIPGCLKGADAAIRWMSRRVEFKCNDMNS